jgi:hypothetical protein
VIGVTVEIDSSGVSALTATQNSRSFEMMQHAMYEVLSRERMRAHDEQVRQAYLRQLVVLHRRQRKVDAARRALHLLSV